MTHIWEMLLDYPSTIIKRGFSSVTYNEGIFSLSILTRPTIQLLLKVGGGVGVLVYELCHKKKPVFGVPDEVLHKQGWNFVFLIVEGLWLYYLCGETKVLINRMVTALLICFHVFAGFLITRLISFLWAAEFFGSMVNLWHIQSLSNVANKLFTCIQRQIFTCPFFCIRYRISWRSSLWIYWRRPVLDELHKLVY